MDIATISMVLMLGLIALLAIGMPLGFASAILAVLVLVMKFEPQLITGIFDPEIPWGFGPRLVDGEAISWWTIGEGGGTLTRSPGTGALYLLAQKVYGLLINYVLISVPLFILMASLLERSGIAKEMYNALDNWLSRTRGGIAIVTSIMAVIMAAMSGIIGGEVVLLGLIALPQMLRLGYNQNLAIGTICASGSLGTMIPPSIVLIIYGLITETSIKALFTGAFLPGFMLASFIIIYIVVRTQLRPQDAPLPENPPDYSSWGTAIIPKVLFALIGVIAVVSAIVGIVGMFGENRFASLFGWINDLTASMGFAGAGQYVTGVLFGPLVMMLGEDGTLSGPGVFMLVVICIFLMALAFAGRTPMGQLFLSFLTVTGAGIIALLFARVLFFTVTGQNTLTEDDSELIVLGMPEHLPIFGTIFGVLVALALIGFGPGRCKKGWSMGKGLVAPILVIGIVMGSIYGGISGITEAAGMGALAVYLLMTFYQQPAKEWSRAFGRNVIELGAIIGSALLVFYVLSPESVRVELTTLVVLLGGFLLTLKFAAVREALWDSLMRTLRSTGTILWVTIGAAALAGAYTLAGGPQFIAQQITQSELPTMGILLMMMVILLFMGAFMDWVGIVLLIIPVFLPIVKELPIEEIGYIGQLEPKYVAVWFGVLFCMNMQVSFLSPPFGPAAFYLKSVAPPHISLTDIFRGFLPFIGVQLCALAVLLIWPSIVTLLL